MAQVNSPQIRNAWFKKKKRAGGEGAQKMKEMHC